MNISLNISAFSSFDYTCVMYLIRHGLARTYPRVAELSITEIKSAPKVAPRVYGTTEDFKTVFDALY